jgi:hypothetical protein
LRVLSKKHNSAPLDEDYFQQVQQQQPKILYQRTKTLKREADTKQELEIIADDEEDEE